MEKQKFTNSGALPDLPAPAGQLALNWGTPQQSFVDGFSETQMDAHARAAWHAGLDIGMAHAPAADETTLPDLARLLGAASRDGKAVKLSAIAAGVLHGAMTTPAQPAQPKLPSTPEEVVAFIGHHFAGVHKGGTMSDWQVSLSVHDLLSAFRDLADADSQPAAQPEPALSHAAIMDRARQIGIVATDAELQGLKADALALAADGANMAMDVGCMFVLAMIERIEAAATAQPAGFINPADLTKIGQCRATLWATPQQADAVPVFRGAPAAAAGNARIAELEAAIDKLHQCRGRYHADVNYKALIAVREKKVAS